MSNREIAILAKSRKCGCHCIAGKEILRIDDQIVVGKWVRPVSGSTGSNGAVSDSECRYQGSGAAQVLDVARVPLDRQVATAGQPENMMIADGAPWTLSGQLSVSLLTEFLDTPDNIWLENHMPTDRCSHHFGSEVDASLYLIRPTDLNLVLSQDMNLYQGYHVRRIRGEFTYNGARYANLSVTDPQVTSMLINDFPAKGQAAKRITLPKHDNYCLCVSLGPQFGAAGCHYKFVASILGCS